MVRLTNHRSLGTRSVMTMPLGRLLNVLVHPGHGTAHDPEPPMKLARLIVPDLVVSAGAQDVEISALTADSRAVVPGALFAALPGSRADGARFVNDAVAKGAAAILAPLSAEVPALAVPVLA